jgi:hypothetical protein
MPSLPACRIGAGNLAVVLQVIPIMDEVALLAEFSALADHTPDFALFTPSSRVHQEWLGKLQALVRQWNPGEVPPLRGEVDNMGFTVVREKAVSNIVGVLYRAIADLQFRIQGAPARAFGPGAVYDFFRNLPRPAGFCDKINPDCRSLSRRAGLRHLSRCGPAKGGGQAFVQQRERRAEASGREICRTEQDDGRGASLKCNSRPTFLPRRQLLLGSRSIY